MALLKSSGYWGSELNELLAPVLDDVTCTFRAAYGKRSEVFTSIIAREEGALIGHVSSLRAYDRTWMMRTTWPACILPHRHVADLLSIRAGDNLLQTTNIEFFKIWYQDNKTWPARVIGGFASGVGDTEQSNLSGYRHVTISTAEALPDPVSRHRSQGSHSPGSCEHRRILHGHPKVLSWCAPTVLTSQDWLWTTSVAPSGTRGSLGVGGPWSP